MKFPASFRPVTWPAVCLASVCLLVAGCARFTAPGEAEAKLIEAAAQLEPLSAGTDVSAGSAVRHALLTAPQVRRAAADVGASADEIRIQRAGLFPSLGLAVTGGFGDAGDGSPSFDLNAEQLLFDFGGTRRKVKIAEIDLQISYLDYHARVDEAIIATLTAWQDEATYREMLGLRRAQLTAMKALNDRVAQREAEGAATASDRLEARKRMVGAEFLVVEAELKHGEAQDRLKRLSGMSQGGSLGRLPQTCSGGEPGRDLLQIARLQEAHAVLSEDAARSASKPRLIASPLVRQPLEEGGAVSFGVNLGLRSDLLQGGALTARVKAAGNEREAAAANTAFVAREAQLRLGEMARELRATQAREGMFARQLQVIDETRSIYRDQYFELGKRDLSDLLDVEEEYYDRQAERLEVIRNGQVTALNCAQSLGTLRQAYGLDRYSLYGYPL